MIYILIFLVIPFAYLLYISFLHYDPIELISGPITLENYDSLLLDPFYRDYIWYTVRISLIVTVLCVIFGYPIGYYLGRASARKRGIGLFLILLPLMVGIVVRSYGWMVLLGRSGFINEVLNSTLGSRIGVLGTTNAVIIGLVGVLLPFVIISIYAAIDNIDEELEGAARSLGANRFQAFYKVTLPLSLNGVITGTIFCFTLSMSSIITPKLLGGRTDVTLGALMYDVAIGNTNWPMAGAIAVTIGVMNVTLIYLYLKLSRKYLEVE
jgi:ABC-type spermidine/putrescine transport system permease subunit I